MESNVVTLSTFAATDSAAGPDLRAQLRELIAATERLPADRRYTQARIAREAGISTTTLSQWLGGTYAGDNDAVEAKLRRWVDGVHAQRAQAEMMPAAPDYVATSSAERVIAALRYAQAAQDIAVIYGGAGLGKTTALHRYQASMPNVWVATMTPASASVVTALEEIADAVGAGAASGGAAKLHRAICRKIHGTVGLLAIDEAQHLSVAALDQIRSLHDATGIGIALVGNEAVYARMTGGNRAAYLDRLYSRIGRKVRLTRATAEDVRVILDAWGVRETECRAHLVDIASKPGALRGLTKVLRLAAMYAAAESRALCCDDVRAAWRELGGAE